MDFAKLTQTIKSSGAQAKLPPVEQWDPPFCGDMNLVIKKNGQWFHEGTPFTRAALVKLFASVIKKEGDQYFLVTPVEKIGIKVEDVPFVIVDWEAIGDKIQVTTQTGDVFTICDQHMVELREFESVNLPYCKVRRNLWARVNQNVFYQWVEYASASNIEQADELLMNSGEYCFSLGKY
jgi:hypothetical protein